MAIQGVDKAPPTKTKEWAGIHMRIKMIMSRVKKECSGSEGDENQQRNKQKTKGNGRSPTGFTCEAVHSLVRDNCQGIFLDWQIKETRQIMT